MIQPDRKYSATDSYRYGFNGKENDNEVKGEGNQQDYGMRIYDPRLGKFLSVDPISKQYPELTPYQFASNRPIQGIDIDGLEFGLSGFNFDPKTNVYARDDFSNKEKMEFAKKQAVTGGLVLAVATDVFITKGLLTRWLLIYEVTSAFPHNPAGTPEARADQLKEKKEHLTNAFLLWGGGKILEVGGNALIKGAKEILKTQYAYGEASVSAKVGKEMVEIGNGGIGSGGYIELEINVKVGENGARVAHGETVFDEIYKSVEANAAIPINGIRGRWSSGDNLANFNKAITEKVNKGLMTIEEAAFETFTGRMAQKKGFNKVQSIEGEKNPDGTYKQVTSILFGKK